MFAETSHSIPVFFNVREPYPSTEYDSQSQCFHDIENPEFSKTFRKK